MYLSPNFEKIEIDEEAFLKKNYTKKRGENMENFDSQIFFTIGFSQNDNDIKSNRHKNANNIRKKLFK